MHPKALPSPSCAAPDVREILLCLLPGVRHCRLAGPAVTRAGHSFINPALARMGLRGGAGNGAGTGSALLGWSWHREPVCMDGAGGRGPVALWLKAHGQLLLALLVAWLSPSLASSSTLSPCLGSAHPNLCPVPPRAGLAEGLTAGNGVGEWCPGCSQQGMVSWVLMPAHRTSPRGCRLFWLLACLRMLLRASVSPASKWKG